jgi:predicted esterase YcpF (UPF0227 family)
MHLIVYLHGFKSSPSSNKAVLTQSALLSHPAVQWYCPQLSPSPRLAMQDVCAYIQKQTYQKISVIGSSLGGYYATYLAEKYTCKASLLNPAIEPARDLEKYIGEQKTWQGDDSFYFKPEYIDELKDLYISDITQPARYQLLVAKGDEVLDWKEMVAKYPGSSQIILEGGDHAISDYPEHLSEILRFQLD